ncbi:MAG: hypothetical protein ACRD9R_18470, partial [Pyrinomonadaceae bacterium]
TGVTPRALRDVPAARLSYRLEPDVSPDVLPESIRNEAVREPLASVKADFENRRKEEALVATVVSPDGQRALALYDPGDISEDEFKLDLYSADGRFLRNVLPANLSGVSALAVNWSPDGQWIAFVGRRPSLAVQPSPTPQIDLPPDASTAPVTTPGAAAGSAPAATIAPIIAPVASYATEQIYVCDRDGYNLRPLTARDGLVYFHTAWSPDGTALAALACKEAELTARLNENRPLAGRPRIIERDGSGERLLDDRLMDAFPVWSPDAAKVATAEGSNVYIYDADGGPPTAARLPLRELLLDASAKYDAAQASRRGSGGETPLSFNPAIRLEWVQPEVLLLQTGFVRIYQNNETVSRYLRWHVLHLSPQAAVLNSRQ